MWQEQGRIVQIDALLSLYSVREHFGVYAFYGIECCKPKILYVGQSKNLINRLLQHFHYPTPGEQTGSFYTIYRDYWQEKHKDIHARPYWQEYWNLLRKSKLTVMAWPIDDDVHDSHIKEIKVLEKKLIHLLKPKYNQRIEQGDHLNEFMQNKFNELKCNLQKKLGEMKVTTG